MLVGKKVLLAVCGSIAAYKTAFFVRLLVKAGAEVRVLMTESAKDFITPLTLATLSKNPVLSSFSKDNGEWNNHVELGLWADIIVIAPLSANTLSKLAHGGCDNLVTATYLSAKCPVIACPAMDLDMYQHPTTRNNISLLKSYGNIIIDAEDGELASGLSGEGRMAEPEHIISHLETYFSQSQSFANHRVVITSGPTHEPIDPVRFIGNHSTGKMGKALALELAHRGAIVDFISGPAAHLPSHANINVTKVGTALEMYDAAKKAFDQATIGIFAAAVADYRPEKVEATKIKKKDEDLSFTMVPNPDIAKELGAIKKKQITVGFALETDDEESNAQQKLQKKNFDIIVLNSLKDKGAGFAHDTNKVSVFDKHNNTTHFELKNKSEVAKDIVDLLENHING
ncbi:MAG: bifunctional phosphopantothenoylcysteine decarboxylase/phosphopantothenate--cysteine ligase CoaBC [Cyclobacteriaceae bacterium]